MPTTIARSAPACAGSDAKQQAAAFVEADVNVFRLHPVDGDGNCTCFRGANCPAAGKHPRDTKDARPNFLARPDLFEIYRADGQFDVSFGVDLASARLLVIDIDGAAGEASFAKLSADCPEVAGSAFVVRSGRAAGGRHLYFRIPASEGNGRLRAKLPDRFPSIDFKTSGFTVGPGSKHKSGTRYEAAFGTVEDVEDAPEGLLALLRRPVAEYVTRSEAGAGMLQASGVSFVGDHWTIAQQALSLVEPDPNSGGGNRAHWLEIGGHLRAAFGDAGFALWDAWSATGESYDARVMEAQWDSLADFTGGLDRLVAIARPCLPPMQEPEPGKIGFGDGYMDLRQAVWQLDSEFKRDLASRIWNSSLSIDGTPGETYLRGLGLSGGWDDLRWYPGDARQEPCLVANVAAGGIIRIDTRTGEWRSLGTTGEAFTVVVMGQRGTDRLTFCVDVIDACRLIDAGAAGAVVATLKPQRMIEMPPDRNLQSVTAICRDPWELSAAGLASRNWQAAGAVQWTIVQAFGAEAAQ